MGSVIFEPVDPSDHTHKLLNHEILIEEAKDSVNQERQPENGKKYIEHGTFGSGAALFPFSSWRIGS